MPRIALSAILLLCAPLLAAADDWRASEAVQGSFADTRDAVVTAIENRGLVINASSHISDMLDRTGSDLGKSRRIYEKAEILEFCSAALSRQMMETNPHDIVNCPFTIAIYTLAGQPATTWVGYRRQAGQSAAAIEKMLADIVAEALH